MFKLFGKNASIDWIVVFLGNPGAKYDGTRHNAGFMTGDKCEKDLGVEISRLKFKALTAQAKLDDKSLLLMKPQTYMNLSGEAVAEAAKFYKVAPEHILVVSDDVSLPLGKLRVRSKGSAGGHNGLKSIISCLGTDAFPRIKLGVGAPAHPDYDMADWVLGVFKGQDAKEIDLSAERAWQAAACYIREGADRAMNRFN